MNIFGITIPYYRYYNLILDLILVLKKFPFILNQSLVLTQMPQEPTKLKHFKHGFSRSERFPRHYVFTYVWTSPSFVRVNKFKNPSHSLQWHVNSFPRSTPDVWGK